MTARRSAAPDPGVTVPRPRPWARLAVAAALAAAASAPAAAPQRLSYEIYGSANLSLDYLSNDDTAPGQVQNAFALSSNQSYLGVLGVQPLSRRWLAVARLEGGVEGDTGHIFDTQLRDTYVGIAGPYGLVKAGHFSSPYKLATEWMDPFRDTLGDAQAVLGNVDGTVLYSEWYNNSIAWQSPEFHGWQVDADYIINQDSDQLPQTTAAAKRSAWSIDMHGHGTSTKGGFAVERRNATANTGAAGTQAITAEKVYIASWVPSARRTTLVTGVYEHAQGVDLAGTRAVGRSALYLSITHHWRTLAFKGATGWLSALNGQPHTGAFWYGLGVSHSLSPRVENYLLLTMISNEADATYGLGQFQGGPQHGNGNVPGLPGRSVFAFSLGLKVTFGGNHPS